ncbi:MAG: hypothetical protein DI626_08090 [Micavibrio aeruginosavorus]|uniref:Uncharacterized protein n=1 Tax=Micavibrio aeruginosavorus TaxID=349221 RepID=A0A2W5BT20_9BACT|nr:MAG: hypothetical protein DI626_08090 [Micavibrio aeruginosavorus]
MILSDPFKEVIDPHSRKLPVVSAIAVEDTFVKVLMHGVGSIRQYQYHDVVLTRAWRNAGLKANFICDYSSFNSDVSIDGKFGVDGDRFVIQVENGCVRSVLEALETIKVITLEQKSDCYMLLNIK